MEQNRSGSLPEPSSSSWMFGYCATAGTTHSHRAARGESRPVGKTYRGCGTGTCEYLDAQYRPSDTQSLNKGTTSIRATALLLVLAELDTVVFARSARAPRQPRTSAAS